MRRATRMHGLLPTTPYSLLTVFFQLVICHSSLVIALSAQGVITTVAGSGRVFRGDGGLAVQAQLGLVQGVTVDSAGNVYATDASNDIVVKISPAGIIRVIAGNNVPGFSGVGGLAVNASLNLGFANGVATDNSGNVYIADRENERVRKVNSDGIITTFAGNGLCCFSEGGLAVNTPICNPQALALNAAGNLYITACGRVLKVDPGGIISSVAGTRAGGFSGDGGLAIDATLDNPVGLAVDSAGNIFVAEYSGHRVRKITTDGRISTVAGNGTATSSGDGGPAANATLNGPTGVALDEQGNLYIAEWGSGLVRKVSPNGIITTFAGGGGNSPEGVPATNANLNVTGIAFAAGKLYIADHFRGRVLRVDSSGIIATIAGTNFTNFSGDGVPAISSSLNNPWKVAVDTAGSLYIADGQNNRVRKVNSQGAINTVAGNGLPGFSGDGGPATSATLNNVNGLAVDEAGNIFIADAGNNRIRKVAPSGIISTVVGNGSYGFSGDGGPAMSASLAGSFGVAVDRFGNLYIAEVNNQRIRRVGTNGLISTVAGSGPAPLALGAGSFSGDGGPATSARLNSPGDVAVDAQGNLFVADSDNHRIRKVTPDGIISTFAGGGSLCCQDGIPATTARLSRPFGVFVDQNGNVYIGESNGQRIRKVTPDGIITTVAGNGSVGFSGDGGPATSAQLSLPRGGAVDQAGNVYFADSNNDRIRKVWATPPSFSIVPASLTFRAQAGSGTVLPQRLTITSSAIGLAWAIDVSTETGGNWLSVSPASGTMPGLADVAVNASNLAPGTYRGTVTIVAALAAAPIQTIRVTLTVEEPLPPRLTVEPGSLTFEALVGAVSPGRTLRINNAGGGSLDWTVRAETSTGGNWLSVAPISGAVSSSASNQVQVSVSGAALAAGFYSGAVVVASSTTNEPLRVPVNLLIAQSRQTMLLSQSGLLFTGVEGGGVIPSQNFGVINIGEGVMNWTAQVSTLSGGNWLTVSPREGVTDAASLQVPLVDVGVNVAGLAAGAYSGQVRVTAPTASNATQFITVILNVLPRGSNPGPQVRPTGLIFAAQTGTSSPSSQTLSLSTVTPVNVDVVSGLLTTDGGNWIEALPRNLTLSPADATRRIVVQPSLGSFTPGVYRGALTMLFTDGSPPQVVSVLFLVVRQTGSVTAARGAQAGLLEPQTHSACVPTQLFATHRTLGTSFASPVGWPSTIEAQVADDCGHAVSDATVVARFSNGDPQIVLTSLRNGLYVGTWRPATEAAQVAVIVRAELPPLAAAEVAAQGSATSNATAPAVFAGGIVNTASYGNGEGLAPGSIVSVFGRNLARGENLASRFPLETSLGGVRLSIGGVDTPLLFAGNGQINAQVPFELVPNTRQTVVIRTTQENGTQAYAVPEIITIASARPAIFTVNEAGTGQGAILNQDGSPNSAANPAARGSVVQIYATGLGATNPPVSTGSPAPVSPLAVVASPVTATLGGVNAVVQFAGLAPGYAGLYQVNIEIPAGVSPGLESPLTLTQNGVPSNTITLAVQ